jgi:tetratricopeptide (TPR) repeat protein
MASRSKMARASGWVNENECALEGGLMRHVGSLVIMGCCSWAAATAWAAHTITPPGLQPGFGGTVQSSDSVDPGTPQWVLGDKLVKALNAGDLQALTNLIDIQGLEKRFSPGLQRHPRASSYIDDRFFADMVRATLESYCKAMNGAHGTAKLLQIKMHAGQPRIRIRLDQGALGFTYLDFVGDQERSGEFRVIQWYELNDGVLVTETLADIARLGAGPDDTTLGSIFSTSPFDPDRVDQIRQIEVLRGRGQYAESLEAFSQLPSDVTEKLVALKMRAQDARRVNNMSAYNRALDLIDLHYGRGNPALALTLIDYYIDKGDIDKALEAVDAFESRIGVDAGTCLMRARILFRAGEYGESVTYARKAVEREPDLDSAWYSLGKGYVGLKNYPQAVATYKTMQTRFHTTFTREAFVRDPNFSAFAQSRDFEKWLSR